MTDSSIQRLRLPGRLIQVAVVCSWHLDGMTLLADDHWLPPRVVSQHNCDAVPRISKRPPLPQHQSEPMQTLAPPMQSLTVLELPLESADTNPRLPDATSVEPRLQRLRELFGELHNRLEFPPAVMTQQEPETVETEVIEVISPLPADSSSDDHELSTSSKTVSEETVLSPVVEHVDPLPFFLPEHIASGAIDRLELADNLFAADELQMALDVYAAIDLDAETEVSRVWIMFQMAACYRRLGDITEASKRYRQLVTIADTTWVGDLSRWWLNIIDTQQTLSNTTNELDAVIQQLQESVHADIRSGNGTL